MKRALILHALDVNSGAHWYPWLKKQLEALGYEVWLPDLPHPEMPNARKATDLLLSNTSRDFNNNLIIGHSWGSVQATHLLQNLPEDVKAGSVVLIGTFKEPLEGMKQQHAGIFTEAYNYPLISTKAKKFLVVHGDNDPWCPLDGAKEVANKLGAEMEIIAGGQHFSTSIDPSYTSFPLLIETLQKHEII